MNTERIRENLINTIRNKETYLGIMLENVRAYDSRADRSDGWMVAKITADFLELNINELKVILHDVETVCQMSVDTSAQKLYN